MQIIQRRYCQTLTRHKRGINAKAASNRTVAICAAFTSDGRSAALNNFRRWYCCQLCPNQYNQTRIFTKLLSNKLCNQMVGRASIFFQCQSLPEWQAQEMIAFPFHGRLSPVHASQYWHPRLLLISGFVVFAIDTIGNRPCSMSSAYARAKALNRFLKLIRHAGMVKYETYRNSLSGAGIRLCQKELRTIDCHFLWKR